MSKKTKYHCDDCYCRDCRNEETASRSKRFEEEENSRDYQKLVRDNERIQDELFGFLY